MVCGGLWPVSAGVVVGSSMWLVGAGTGRRSVCMKSARGTEQIPHFDTDNDKPKR